MGITPLVMSIL